jgi:hypothetical protein
MKTWKIVTLGVLTVVVLFGLGLGLELFGIKWRGVTEPMREEVRRNVFENTQSYVHGKNQDLGKHYYEWLQADDSGKETIEAIIRIQFVEFPLNKVNDSTLAAFLQDVRGF